MAVIMLIIIDANAQVSIGAKAGGHSSGATIDDFDGDVSRALGFHVGGFVEFAPVKFGAKAEILFAAKGFNTETDATFPSVDALGNPTTVNVSSESKIRYNSIDIPLMGVYKLAGPFSIEAGPQFSYFLGGNVETESTANGVTTTTDVDFDPEDDLYTGFVVGANLNLPVVGAYVRYNHQFEDGGSQNWIMIGVSYSIL